MWYLFNYSNEIFSARRIQIYNENEKSQIFVLDVSQMWCPCTSVPWWLDQALLSHITTYTQREKYTHNTKTILYNVCIYPNVPAYSQKQCKLWKQMTTEGLRMVLDNKRYNLMCGEKEIACQSILLRIIINFVIIWTIVPTMLETFTNQKPQINGQMRESERETHQNICT